MNPKTEDFIKVVKTLKPSLVSCYSQKSWLRNKIWWELGFYAENAKDPWAIRLDNEKDLIEAKREIEKVTHVIDNNHFLQVADII